MVRTGYGRDHHPGWAATRSHPHANRPATSGPPGRDWPIWLEINSEDKFSAFIRYNGGKKIQGQQNYYFDYNPLPKIWGNIIIKKIISGQIEYGMKEEQVRISIGNPNIINNTSSRHSVSEQWIYGNTVGEKKFLLFEYGKLVSM